MSDSNLRAAALIALVLGAVASVSALLYAGRDHHPGMIVIVGFVGWVLSPFVILALGHLVSSRWSPATRFALYSMMFVITAASLITYAILALGPPRKKMVAIFVMVPPISWAVIAAGIPILALIARSLQDKSRQ